MGILGIYPVLSSIAEHVCNFIEVVDFCVTNNNAAHQTAQHRHLRQY